MTAATTCRTARTARRTWGRAAGAGLVAGLVAGLIAGSVCGVALLATGGAPRPAPPGLSDAGLVTGWALPVTRVVLELAAILAVGALLVALGAPSARARMLRLARTSAAIWCLAAAAGAVSTVAELSGSPLVDTVSSRATPGLLLALPQGRALLVVTAITAVLAGSGRRVAPHRAASVWPRLVAAVFALATPVETGHAVSSGHHYVATQALVVHVVAASLWVGGLAVLAVALRGRELRAVLPWFSRVAGGCFVAVAVTGIVTAWLRVGAHVDAWDSAYGAALGTKVAIVAGLGAAGWRHRRRTIWLVVAGRQRAFLWLAGLELALMAVATGLGVALSRSPLPPAAASRIHQPHASLAETVDAGLPDLGARALLLRTDPDPLLVPAALVLLVLLIAGLRRRGARGGGLVRMSGALLLGSWSTFGGLAAYSAAVPEAQVAQVLVLGLVVAPLGVSGWAASRPGATWPWHAPDLGLLGLLAVLGLLCSPALDVTLQSTQLHRMVAIAALVAGLSLWGPVLADVAGRSRDDARPMLLVLAVVLASQGVLLVTGYAWVGGGWFSTVGPARPSGAQDQLAAGLLMIASGVALAVVVRRERRRSVRARAAAPAAPVADLRLARSAR